MTKKLISVLVTAVITANTVPFKTSAEETETKSAYSDGYYIEFYLNENSEAVITTVSGQKNSIKIPSSIGGYTVTGIAERTFYQQSQLETVTFPNTIEKIGDYAFAGCTGISEIILPDSLNSIGKGSFMSCTRLKSVKFGNGLADIPEKCFYSCPELESTEFSESLKTVGNEAFFSCTSLYSVALPESIEFIGENAFGKFYSIRENSADTVAGFSIIGKSGAYIQDYAEENNYNFISNGEIDYLSGDVNNDGYIDATDASMVLIEYSLLSTGNKGTFNAKQRLCADKNHDGKTDASDSSMILIEYAERSTQK